MTGKRFVGAGLLAVAFASGCGDGGSSKVQQLMPVTGPSRSMAPINPVVFQGEKIHATGVINVLYNWDVGDAGPVVYAARPMGPQRWPEHNNMNSVDFIYVVVYPVGSTVTGLMCYDTPNETCPDHGPVISAGAMQADPQIYGGGVLGHDHLSPPKATPAHAYAVFVLFKNPAKVNTHITTIAQIQAAVQANDAFLYPVPSLTFHNAPVDGRIYELATPWICPAYSFCAPPTP
jgi:hypothetical protein